MVMTLISSPWVHAKCIDRASQFTLALMLQETSCSWKFEKMAWCYVLLMAQLLNAGGLNVLLI
jgi:hypothetical protein